MLLNCGVGEDSWESLGLQGDPTSPFWRRSALGFLWKEWCWSWNSSTLSTSCKELTHWKRLWCWEGLGAGGEGDDRGGNGWMASLTGWTWVWVNSGRWWWTGRPGVLWFMGSQRVGHDWATELNWTKWDQMLWSLFFECWVLSQFFHSPLSLSSRAFSVPLCFRPLEWCHLHIWGYCYFSLQSWLCLCLCFITWHFTWCTLHINKQGDNIQPRHNPFPISQLSVYCSGSKCRFLSHIQVSQEAGKVVWYSHLFQSFPQFIVIHTVKGFSLVNGAEVDVFLCRLWRCSSCTWRCYMVS